MISDDSKAGKVWEKEALTLKLERKGPLWYRVKEKKEKRTLELLRARSATGILSSTARPMKDQYDSTDPLSVTQESAAQYLKPPLDLLGRSDPRQSPDFRTIVERARGITHPSQMGWKLLDPLHVIAKQTTPT